MAEDKQVKKYFANSLEYKSYKILQFLCKKYENYKLYDNDFINPINS